MLTDAAITRAKVRPTPRKLADAQGLYLLIRPDGKRYWRWDYRFQGKRLTLSFGVYPEVRLHEARRRLADGRALLRDGINPSAARRAAKQPPADRPAGLTFAAVLADWQQARAHLLAPVTQAKQRGIIGRYLTGLGARPIASLTAPIVLDVLRPLERSGRRETAHEVKRIVSQVLRYGIATGVCERDCTADLRGALPAVKERHHAALTEPKAIGALLRALHRSSGGSLVVDVALRLLPLVFVRPAELRGMAWAEIDFDAALWRIPAHRMKMRRPHLVPLSTQAVKLLREIQAFTGAGRFVFPGFRDGRVPMSANAMNLALKRRGYGPTQQTPHGFRTMASTRLHELGCDSAHVEMQLAHAPAGVKGVYNQAQYLAQRVELMQRWADYLDALRTA